MQLSGFNVVVIVSSTHVVMFRKCISYIYMKPFPNVEILSVKSENIMDTSG